MKPTAGPALATASREAPRPLRVTVVGPSHHFYSGVSNYTASVLNAFVERYETEGLLLRKLCPEFLYPLRSQLGSGIGSLAVDGRARVYDRIDYHDPMSWRKARREMRLHRPDVVLIQWWTGAVAHMYWPILREARRVGAKVVVEMHEVMDPTEAASGLVSRYSRFAIRPILRAADAFIVHSTADGDLISKSYGIASEKLHVVPHGLYDYHATRDEQAARAEWSTAERFGLLQFGSVRKYKGTDVLLDAFDQLPADVAAKCRLTIAGGLWDDSQGLRERIARSPHAASIRLTGEMVPDAVVGDLFAAHDLVTLTYLRASQSGVAHIAMAVGKPIVATRVGGLAESLQDYSGTRFVDVEASSIARGLLAAFREWEQGVRVKHPAPRVTFADTAAAYDRLFHAILGKAQPS